MRRMRTSSSSAWARVVVKVERRERALKAGFRGIMRALCSSLRRSGTLSFILVSMVIAPQRSLRESLGHRRFSERSSHGALILLMSSVLAACSASIH